jgi:hypothetical protein
MFSIMMQSLSSYAPVWKVCIAQRISPARNFDAFYIITIKFLKSPARNFQTFQSGIRTCCNHYTGLHYQ